MKLSTPFLLLTLLPATTALAESSRYSSSLYLQDAPALEETITAPDPIYGQPDHWWWTIGGGGGTTFADDEYSAAVFAGASTFLADDFELSLDLTIWFIAGEDPIGDDAVAINFNPKFRWHFIHEESHTVFAELGVGLMLATEEVPEGGSEFNFAPQAGIGATWALNDGPNRLITGINWRHFSNANSSGSDRNPGHDEIFIYVGLTFPF